MADGEGGGPRHEEGEKEGEGEWAGWRSWGGRDPFEALTGPFYTRLSDEGLVCAVRVQPKHMNGQGGLHGGLMMTFADYALFLLSLREREGGAGLTVNLTGDFLGTAVVGERLEARGEVTRAGGSLVFVRGMVTAEEVRRPVLSFSGVIKRLRPRG